MNDSSVKMFASFCFLATKELRYVNDSNFMGIWSELNTVYVTKENSSELNIKKEKT